MAPPAVLTTNGITSPVVYCGLHHQLSAHVADGTTSCFEDNSIAVRRALVLWFEIFAMDVFVLVVLNVFLVRSYCQVLPVSGSLPVTRRGGATPVFGTWSGSAPWQSFRGLRRSRALLGYVGLGFIHSYPHRLRVLASPVWHHKPFRVEVHHQPSTCLPKVS